MARSPQSRCSSFAMASRSGPHSRTCISSNSPELPRNYITVQESAPGNEGGFSSSVGMAGGEQFVQFGPHSWNRGTVCHEVGHALGLWHEQQRPDRDTYVIIHWNNIDPIFSQTSPSSAAVRHLAPPTIFIRSCITSAMICRTTARTRSACNRPTRSTSTSSATFTIGS